MIDKTNRREVRDMYNTICFVSCRCKIIVEEVVR